VKLRAGQWFTLSVGLLVVVAVIGTIASVLALSRLTDARVAIADRLDPAAIAASDLKGALVDQETGIRGYALTAQSGFLEPYARGQTEAADAIRRLDAVANTPDLRSLRKQLEAVLTRAAAWQTEYAEPTRQRMAASAGIAGDVGAATEGKRRFDSFRGALDSFDSRLNGARLDARTRLDHSAAVVQRWVIGTGIVILLSVLAAAMILRNVIVVPLGALAARVRDVAGGRYEEPVAGTGAREVVTLGSDVDGMRSRIVAELEALRVVQADLERSNQELEQFAYVASHDLQEPLRKVASFTQLLQQRYGGELDERADQYIGFAVDGARRMQTLINDLLAFSRVGRMEHPHGDVDCNELVERVRGDLAGAIEDSGATIEADPLPTVSGDASLLRLVFQNLVGNAIKFRSGATPVVRLSAERDGDIWRFRCADNGIGIDAEYADRIFVIFQRLHSRSAYEGTGIGLAMCRKIVEYHGGRMWLDTENRSGSAFCFTLPARPEDR
jgi:signal transduction histidine kinase